ncbi:Coxsackievirus and adenovirus receptor -like protein [Collichthys lucidus]|uniref:Coxsackievirus and adenovirus receptor-like protein n=1 Tax=Collichthys lucidus TaxID=240159 RepID=A0A4U5UWK9_COLLU|nr:Coxsackievirus and adenovirus receptor -like protein [Collichthys lucidus]
METLFTRLKLLLLFLVTIQQRTEAMEVASTGPQTIQKAQGVTVKLPCTYTPGPEDTGELDIEWSNVSPDMTQKDQLLLSFTGGRMHQYGDPSVSSRLKFTGNPKLGDASISISDVRLSDTATYHCKVKKAPGVDTRKVTLVVMVPPSTPKCWVDGGEERGGTVSLRCESSVGSTPLSYTWTRESGGAMPVTATQDPQGGELLIKNHSDSNVGNYVCEVKNAVGREQCKYALHAYNQEDVDELTASPGHQQQLISASSVSVLFTLFSSAIMSIEAAELLFWHDTATNKAGVIAGAVIGALLLLLLLLLLIWLLICCCHKRRYQKEVANEIREDAPAPESRPNSRNSSFRSVMGYRTHPGVQYSSVRNHHRESGRSAVYTGGSNGTSQPAAADRPAPLQYDHKYGYPV